MVTDQSEKMKIRNDFEFEEEKLDFDIDLEKPNKKPTH